MKMLPRSEQQAEDDPASLVECGRLARAVRTGHAAALVCHCPFHSRSSPYWEVGSWVGRARPEAQTNETSREEIVESLIRQTAQRLRTRYPERYELAWLAAKHPRSFVDALDRANFHNRRASERITIHCEICNSKSQPIYRMYPIRRYTELGIGPLRENFICRSCGSSIRQRAIFGVVDSILKSDSPRTIVDTDEQWPGRRPLEQLPGYISTTFDTRRPLGSRVPGGARNEDLTRLTFDDASVDLFMSGDVHEHIDDTMTAFREVRRVLKPNGAYVFTVPYRHSFAGHQRLAYRFGPDVLWNGVRHIHGDPRSSAGASAYWLFGRELLDQLGSMGFDATRLEYGTRGMEMLPVDVFRALAV